MDKLQCMRMKEAASIQHIWSGLLSRYYVLYTI